MLWLSVAGVCIGTLGGWNGWRTIALIALSWRILPIGPGLMISVWWGNIVTRRTGIWLRPLLIS